MQINEVKQNASTKPPMLVQRSFGNTDLRVSEFGIGCQSLAGGIFRPMDPQLIRKIVRQAFDHGVNFFDLSHSYGDLKVERLVGEAFRHERDKVILAAKIGEHYPGMLVPLARARYLLKPLRRVLQPVKTRLHKLMYSQMQFSYSPQHITKAVDDTLMALGTDYLDLCQMHTPPASILESGEFIDVLRALRSQGKVRYFGVYLMNVDDGLIALKHPDISSIQVPFSLFNQRAAEKLFSEAGKSSVAIITKQPFAHGVLTNDPQPVKAEFMASSASGLTQAIDLSQSFRFLASHGRTMAQAALRFVLAFPEVSVVVSGIGNLQELEENLGYCQTPALTEEELNRAMSVRHTVSYTY